MNRVFVFVSVMVLVCGCRERGTTIFEISKNSFNPQSYICQRATQTVEIDGKADDNDWVKAQWTNHFVDIQGDVKPRPQYQTRLKMLWDDEFLYFFAEMEEPHIWATLTQHDAVIYHDNDFEIFIDPSGDTYHYLEYEVNALGTIWDLMISKPYRDHGLIFNCWNINGIRQSIGINGTINNAFDVDQSWTVEVAIPMNVLREANDNRTAKPGDIWRLNFSRVQWNMDVVDGDYVKKRDGSGKSLPEENWVWSPQGVIAMHEPEKWGFLQFSGQPAGSQEEAFVISQDEWMKWALRHIYYRQNELMAQLGRPATLKELGMERIVLGDDLLIPEMVTMGKSYQARIQSFDKNGWWNIRKDGYVWKE